MQELALWVVYIGALFGPFVQEDAAIFGATTASMSMQVNEAGVLAAALVGLILSDAWKYWAGRFAERSRTASKWVANPRVQAARERVLNRLGVALLAARFIPGTRVPLYIACGVFKVPFGRFLFYITLSGALYIGSVYALFHSLDMMTGERVRALAPFIALALVALLLAIGWLNSRRNTSIVPADVPAQREAA